MIPLIQYFDSPIGCIAISQLEDFICAISFVEEKGNSVSTPLLNFAKEQLKNYFEGSLTKFEFPMKQDGTLFQQNVWQEIDKVFYAETITYATLANRMKHKLAIRAIAAANGKNQLLIAIPCHRVVGLGGKPTGYAGKIWRKQWLLNHEMKIAQKGQSSLDI